MSATRGDAGKEGLALFALVPLGALKEILFFVGKEIAVGLPRHQRGVVTGSGEERRDGRRMKRLEAEDHSSSGPV
jgi:hypothetical protein